MDDDIEMDDDQEQEHEHEPIDEPDYDDQEDDVDQDEDDDDMDDDDNDNDADDDDDDDDEAADDDDQDDASDAPSRNGSHRSPRDEALSAATYLRKVHERRALFRPPSSCVATTLGYQIEPMAAAPHSSHIHAMALSLDGQTLLTGGSDGHVRKYDIHATMNGKTMLTQNVRHGFVEGITRGGTLTAFWPHEEHLPSSSSSSTLNSPMGPEKDRLVGVVHSLAIQQDALWGLSGSESGNIHLYGVRHEPGVTRHVFRRHKGAVSALAVMQDEAAMVSGGWDEGVHQWDLNTGQVVRSFPGHTGPISGLAFRPLSMEGEGRLQDGMNVAIHPEAAGAEVDEDEEEEDKIRNEGLAGRVDEANEKLANGDQEEDGSAIKKEAHQSEDSDAPIASSTSKDVAGGAQANGQSDDSPSTQDDAAPAEDPSDSKEADAAQDDRTGSTDPSSAISATDKADKEETTKTPAKQSLTHGSSTVTGDDPTDEELAFEAELNASLGMALDGSGGAIKADGTRPDSFNAGASGTTAGGLMVAGADQDFENDGEDDDLFGGDTPPASSSSAVKDKEANGGKSEPNGAGRNDSDGDDSLFGDGDEDGDGDADGDVDAEVDADGDAEADGDGDGDEEKEDGSSDEDMPLAGRSMAKNPSSQSILAQDTASPSLPSGPMLPSSSATTDLPLGTAAVKDTQVDTKSPSPKPSSPPKKALPKPAFGGFSTASSFNAPLSTFSKDVMLTTSLSGQVILWDLRCPTYTSPDAPAKGVLSLPLPAKVPPWCQSAIFNSSGDKIYVGRRNETVDEWDLRMPSAARHVRSLRLPTGSGPVYSLAAMPNKRHIITGSYDNIRLWDTQFVSGSAAAAELKVPFKIVAGHHGASLSSVLVDASCRFLISASGDRGWMGSSTEAVIIHDIKAL